MGIRVINNVMKTPMIGMGVYNGIRVYGYRVIITIEHGKPSEITHKLPIPT